MQQSSEPKSHLNCSRTHSLVKSIISCSSALVTFLTTTNQFKVQTNQIWQKNGVNNSWRYPGTMLFTLGRGFEHRQSGTCEKDSACTELGPKITLGQRLWANGMMSGTAVPNSRPALAVVKHRVPLECSATSTEKWQLSQINCLPQNLWSIMVLCPTADQKRFCVKGTIEILC